MVSLMDAHAHKAAIRFITSLDRGVDADSFGDDDAWAFMQDLVNDYAIPGRGLNEVQLAALRDFGIAAGMRPGGPLSSYQPALQAAFGPRQMSDENFVKLVHWAHSQVNGGGSVVNKVRTNSVHMDAEFSSTAGWHKKTDLK